jgi:hypothetical protein
VRSPALLRAQAQDVIGGAPAKCNVLVALRASLRRIFAARAGVPSASRPRIWSANKNRAGARFQGVA